MVKKEEKKNDKSRGKNDSMELNGANSNRNKWEGMKCERTGH